MPAIVPSMGTRVFVDLTPPAVVDAVLAPMVAPGPDAGPRQKLLDRVRHAIRTRHYSRRTEQAYVDWIRRYIAFHRMTHPAQMGASHVSQFLTWLAVDRRVSASTQNQALSALLFLYTHASRSRSRRFHLLCASARPNDCQWCSVGRRSARF
jgi:hypothetical protein